MAEEILIGELDIDVDELTEKLTLLNNKIREQKQEVKELEASQDELRKQGKQSSTQYKEQSARIETLKADTKALSTDYRNNQKVLTGVIQSETQQLGTLERLAVENRNLRQEQKKLNLETEEGQKRNKEINAQLDKNTETIRENSDSYVQTKMNIGNYQSALEGLPGPLGSVVSGIRTMTQAGLAFIATPLGAVIAAIVAAIALLRKGFLNSQKAMDVFNQTMDAVSAAVAVIADRISNFVEGVLAVFNKELRESRKATKELQDEMLGLDDSMSRREKRRARRQAKKGLAEEIREEVSQARDLTKAMQQLEDREIDYIQTKAELTRQVEEYRLTAKDAELTERERLDALDSAIELERQMIEEEVSIAKERARISQERIDQGNSTREELRANAELQARAIEVETQGIKRIRTIASERLSTIRKINAEQAKAVEERKKKYEEELEFYRKMTEEMEEAAQEREEAMIDSLIETLDEEIQIRIEREERLAEFERNRVLHNLQSERMLREQAAENEFERRRIQLEHQREMEVEQAEKLNADVDAINRRYAMIEVELERQVQRQKYQVVADFSSALAGLFGEQTGIAKAAAIAQATINTYLGATAAFAQTPGGIVIKSLAAAAAVAAGLANIRQIVKVKAPGGSSGGGSVPSANQTQPAEARTTSDGGLVTRDLTQDNTGNLSAALGSALKQNRQVVVVDQVTAKQQNMDSVEANASV